MVKLWNFFKNNLLKIGISFLILFIPLYPKLPSVHVTHTWVYIRLEDFFIFLVVGLWLLGLLLKKVKLPPKIWIPFALYLTVGLISLIYSLIFIAPGLANFFPSVAVLYYIRHIEYLILFFVAFSTIKSVKDVRDYLVILSVAILGFSIYALGQRFYLDLWQAFPKFFQKFPFCFPSFQTGNEEFAKGIPLCLPSQARITSTFAGHYDLAAYLVLVIPIFIALIFYVKKKINKIVVFLLTLLSIMVLIFTSSRVSFIAYLLAITVTLILIKRKKFIFPFYILSIVLLLIFSGSTAKRFMETFRFASVVTNNQGQIIGTLPEDLKNKVSSNVIANEVTQNLPAGSGYLGLPQLNSPQTTNKAIVQSALSIAEAKRLKLENGGVEISTVSGNFLIKRVLVYDISFTTRFQAEWPNAWNAMLRNPLLGSGFATITLAADNNYLRILGETGLLGLIAFLSIFFVFAITLKQALKKIEDSWIKALLLGLAGGVIGLFFNAVLIDVFEASKVAETLWILLGIAAGAVFVYKKDFEYKPTIKRIITSHVFTVFYLFFIFFAFYMKSFLNFFVADDFTWLKWAATTNLNGLAKFFVDSEGFFYRPLDKVIMFFLYTLFSFSASGYHIFLLLIHFAISIAIYLIVQRLFGKKPLSFIAAFIFLFLPSQGENLFWISTLSTTLSVFFISYMLIFWMNFRKTGSKLNYLFALLFSIFALFSYEGSIIVLPLIILLDLFINKVKAYSDKSIISYIPFAILSFAYPFIRQAAHTVAIGGDYSYNAAHLIPNFFGNFIGYFSLYVLGEKIIPIYSSAREILKGNSLYIMVLLIMLVLLILGVIFYKKSKILALFKNENFRILIFSLIFIFVSLIPFLGLGNIAERYSYLGAFGFSIFIVVILKWITDLMKNKKSANYFLIIFTVFIGFTFYIQLNKENAQWHEAGRITNRTLGYLRLYYDGKHSHDNFYFVNVPIRKADAWIFPVGLEDGIWFIYRDNTIAIHKIDSLDQGKALAKLKNNFVFAFDKNDNIYAVK